MPGTRTFTLSFILAASLGAQTWLPLEVGNEWQYKASRGSESWKLKVGRTEKHGEREYAVVSGFPAGPLWIRVDEQGRPWRLDPQSKHEKLWGLGDDCTGAVVEQTPGFVRYLPGACADAGISYDEYAMGVGLLRRSVTSIAGPVHYDLVYAKVNGKEMEIPKLNWTARARHSGGVVHVEMALRAHEETTVEFSSGQTYDLAIVDETGNIVYSWAKDKMFAMMMRSETVKPGEVKRWTEEIREKLKPGKYVLRATLTAIPQLQATTPLAVP